MKSTSASKGPIIRLANGAIIIIAMVSTATVKADIEHHVSTLKECISKSIEIETERAEADVDSVLKRCQSAYRKLIFNLPKGSEHAVYDDLMHGIKAQLEK